MRSRRGSSRPRWSHRARTHRHGIERGASIEAGASSEGTPSNGASSGGRRRAGARVRRAREEHERQEREGPHGSPPPRARDAADGLAVDAEASASEGLVALEARDHRADVAQLEVVERHHPLARSFSHKQPGARRRPPTLAARRPSSAGGRPAGSRTPTRRPPPGGRPTGARARCPATRGRATSAASASARRCGPTRRARGRGNGRGRGCPRRCAAGNGDLHAAQAVEEVFTEGAVGDAGPRGRGGSRPPRGGRRGSPRRSPRAELTVLEHSQGKPAWSRGGGVAHLVEEERPAVGRRISPAARPPRR